MSAPIPDIDSIDRSFEIDWLIHTRTCEWCGTTGQKPIAKMYCCWKDEKKHTKHTKRWRVCHECLLRERLLKYEVAFQKFIMPLIRNMGNIGSVADALLNVQPMNQPNANMFYLDYVGDSFEDRRRVCDDPLHVAAVEMMRFAASRGAQPHLRDVHIDEGRNEITMDITITPPVPVINIDFTITPEGVEFPNEQD